MNAEAQNSIVATMIAHERVLVFLLSDYLSRLSPSQRVTIDATLASGAMLELPQGLKLDIDQADDLAGMAMNYADAMKRLFAAALALSDALKR